MQKPPYIITESSFNTEENTIAMRVTLSVILSESVSNANPRAKHIPNSITTKPNIFKPNKKRLFFEIKNGLTNDFTIKNIIFDIAPNITIVRQRTAILRPNSTPKEIENIFFNFLIMIYLQ